jgi:hypothetical protein
LKSARNARTFGKAFLDGNAFNLSQKICVPDRATILAIGNTLQSDLFLELSDIANTSVFDCAQRLGRDRSLLTLLASAQKLGRPKQAAHMIGAKGRSPIRHWRCLLLTILETIALIIATFDL